MSSNPAVSLSTPTSTAQPAGLSPLLVWVLAAGAAFSVACLYYSQPMLGVLAQNLGASDQAVGWVPTLTQLGYAVGILLLAPLGDRHDRRNIIAIKAALLVVALVVATVSPSLVLLLPASLLIGLTATMAQDIVPSAAALAPEQQRGKVVGTVMTGLLTGILLSRVLSGFVAAQFGWRAVFGMAAVTIVLITLCIRRVLPPMAPVTQLPYLQLLASLKGLWNQHAALRRAAIGQGLLATGFSAFWSTLAVYLHGEPFGMGSAVAGSFGLAGAAGALAAPLAGHMADRRGPQVVTRLGAGLAVVAFAGMGLAAGWPVHSQLVVLAVGAVLFDLGVQATLISHQTLIYSIDPGARSRLNAVLFVGMFTGMSLGAALGSALLAHVGWGAVMGMAACTSLAAFGVVWFHRPLRPLAPA